MEIRELQQIVIERLKFFFVEKTVAWLARPIEDCADPDKHYTYLLSWSSDKVHKQLYIHSDETIHAWKAAEGTWSSCCRCYIATEKRLNALFDNASIILQSPDDYEFHPDHNHRGNCGIFDIKKYEKHLIDLLAMGQEDLQSRINLEIKNRTLTGE